MSSSTSRNSSAGSESRIHSEDVSEVIDFSAYDLWTTLRLIVLSGESRKIDVKKGSRQGAIYIAGGDILHSVTADREGDEALFEMLSWEGATHTDVQCSDPLARNMRVPTRILVEILKKEVFQPG